MKAQLKIGTSGYSFQNWIGTVYPERTRSSDMLTTYAKDFDAVEINFTYYRDPTPAIFERMLEKVDPAFDFVVKVPRGMTHERDAMSSVADAFVESLKPLIDAKQLGSVLVQFPQSFHAGDASFDHLKRVADVFVPRGIKASVEFRHKGWYQDSVMELLKTLQLGFVNVDLPPISALPPPSNHHTNDIGYYRLHGRNAEMWYSPPTGSHRYDYLYSETELGDWAQRIEETADAAWKIYVFTNNCHKGSSFVNALQLRSRFEQQVRSAAEAEGTLFASSDPNERILELTQRIQEARAAEQLL